MYTLSSGEGASRHIVVYVSDPGGTRQTGKGGGKRGQGASTDSERARAKEKEGEKETEKEERAREKEEREKAQETERANERESDGGHASKGAAEDSKQLQSPSLSPDGRPIDPATGLPVKRKPGECLGNLLPRF